MTFGDTRWETGLGKSSALERWRYALAVVGAQLRFVAKKWRRGRRARDAGRLALDRIVVPDSACAKAALEKLDAVASPALVNHALRSYVWGSLLGQLDRNAWDAEVLYVATVLHDLGLTAAFHGSCPGASCFTLDGIRGAAGVFDQAPPERSEQMRRAVLLHLNVDVPGAVHGWEAHYVRAGALLDVTGDRHDELPIEMRDAILERHPRLGMKKELVEWIGREAKVHPTSRMATLERLGFCAYVRRAPFAS